MINHKVRVYPSKIRLDKTKQLAWKIAEIASDNAKLNKNSIEMAINRIIDNASVAIASLNRKAVIFGIGGYKLTSKEKNVLKKSIHSNKIHFNSLQVLKKLPLSFVFHVF